MACPGTSHRFAIHMEPGEGTGRTVKSPEFPHYTSRMHQRRQTYGIVV